MSKILALDTSTNACSVALMLDDYIVEKHEIAPREHAKIILPMIDGLLAESGLKLNELDAIAFGKGPGSFTGVRIAAGITQGLAFGAELPVVGISSLQALAQWTCDTYGAENVLAGFDARMDEVYWGVYKIQESGLVAAVVEDALVKPGDVFMPLNDSWVGVGDAWKIYKDTFLSKGKLNLTQVFPEEYPHAASIAKLAKKAVSEGGVGVASDALPLYLRSEKTWG